MRLFWLGPVPLTCKCEPEVPGRLAPHRPSASRKTSTISLPRPSALRQLGHVLVVNSLCVLRLDFDCLIKGLYADQLLPGPDGIVEGFLRIVHHFASNGLKALIGFAE